jgi:hypothetical protein
MRYGRVVMSFPDEPRQQAGPIQVQVGCSHTAFEVVESFGVGREKVDDFEGIVNIRLCTRVWSGPLQQGNTMFTRPLTFAFLALSMACGGPLPFMSGGELAGEEQPVPMEWKFEKNSGVIQLETRPEDPYSVNIAYTQRAGRLYIYAGDTEKQWVKNMQANPLVRLRHFDAIYILRAERVLDPDEVSNFAEAWNDASMFHRDPAELDEVWLYHLTAP